MNDQTETREEQQTSQVAPAHSPPAVIRKAALEAQSAGVLPILPTNIEEAQRYAQGLIAAGQVPDSFKFRKNVLSTPEEIEAGAAPVKHREGTINAPLVLMGVLKSLELGVAPQTGLAGLLPLNGRFSPYGDLFIGLMQRQSKIANQKATRIGPSFDPNAALGEWPDDYGWSFTVWRTGQDEPYVATFTVRDAKRANLWLNKYKEPWLNYPDRMLFNRARAFALRDGFADALIGFDLAGIAEEQIDLMPIPTDDGPTLLEQRRSLLDDDETETVEPEQTEEPKRDPGGLTSLDGFLDEEGIREEVTQAAQERVEGEAEQEGGEEPSTLV